MEETWFSSHQLEEAWEDNSPHARFWRQLLNDRVDDLLNSPNWLRALRYNHDMVRWWQRKCGHIFEERGLNLYQLIADAHGEIWDEEDEQKCAQLKKKNVVSPNVKEKPRQDDGVSLDHARKVRVRKGEKEKRELHVRTGDEGRKEDVQEGR